jgi:gliding motility-associated-like protein
MLRYLFLLLLIPVFVQGQTFNSTGNEKIVIGTNTIISSVGGFRMAGTGTNVLSIPQGTSPYDVSPASKRVLLSNANADYEVSNVALNQTANFFIDIPNASSVALTDLSIVNKSATSNYQVSVAAAAHSAYTAIPVEWEITRTNFNAADINDLVFSWGDVLEPSLIVDKRLFVFNTSSLSWTLLPKEQTVVDEVTNKLTYTGYVGALNKSKFMIAESSFNANIFSLTVSPGTLVPAFAPAILSYDVTVASTTSSFNITPTLGIAGATLTINGVAHTSGTLYTSPLVTNTTIFKLNVTSTNGLATKEYIIRVFKNLTAIPAPEKNWVDLFKGANFDPNNDQQATADTDIVGDINNPLVQAQQNFVSINNKLEKVYYFRTRLANAIKSGSAPGTSFYYGLDVTNDQKLNLVVEANVKAATPYVAYHKHDPAKDGSGPSQTSWMNSTTNINIERKLNATQSKITYYPTVIDASTTNLDMDAPIGGANTGNDTWLEFAFSESSFKSFTKDALNMEKTGDEVYGLVAFTSTSQTANGDIGGINDKTADLSKSWAQLGVILTASLDDITDPVYRDPLSVDVINTKSTNGDARVYGVWNGDKYPNSILTVKVYELDNTTIKQTFTYNNATKATTVSPSTPAGAIAISGLSWYIDVTSYAAGNYKVEAIMSDSSVMPNSDTEIGSLLITRVQIDDLVTDDTTPTITGDTDQAAGATVTIELYNAAGTTLLKTYTTTTTTDGKWSFTIPNADALALGNYELNAKVVVGGSTSTDETIIKIVESPNIDITSTLTHTYGTTALSGTSDQPINTDVDLVLTNDLGEDFKYTVKTITGGAWSFDLNTLPAGNYQVYVSVQDVNGIRVSDEAILLVNKKTLVITAVDKTKVFGELDPALNVTYNSFVNGETLAVLGSSLTLSRVAGETVGEYVITPAGFTSSNYDISFVAGKFTITKKSISSADISVAALPNVVYRGTVYEPLPDVYDRGALISEGIQYSITSYTNNLNVGTASILISGIGNFDGTKTITFNITKAPLSIKAQDKTKVYGEANPALTVTYSGFVNSESEIPASLNFTPTIGRTGLEEVGNYTITPSNVILSNYEVSYQSANFSITSKSITSTDVSIANISDLNYNGLAQTPALSITDSSFDPDKTLVLGTDYNLSYSNNTNVGTATITITAIGNYSGVTTKTFKIVPISLSITAVDKNKTFGASDPALTLSFNGFVNSETETVLGGTLSLTRAAGEPVNTYAITVAGYTSSNYTITFVPGVFTINAKQLSSVDINISPRPDVVYTGSSQSQKPNVYDLGQLLIEGTHYTLGYSANTTDVGTVTVTVTGIGAYSGTKTTTYAITKASLTVKAGDKSKVFGTTDPTLTVTYTGFVGGQSEISSSLNFTPTISRSGTEAVGTYTITPSNVSLSNYEITYETGTFIITARSINAAEISIDPLSAVTFNGSAFTPTLVIKDGTTTLASPASYSLSYTNNTNAGTATITITGAGNYSGTRTVTFTINKAALSISAEAKSKTYGTADPTFTVTYSGFVGSPVDDKDDLNGVLGFTRASGESVGTSYAITPNGYLSGNYTITYNPANLTIAAKNIDNASDISIAPMADVVYKGADYEILPVVKDGNTLLIKDTDYTLAYSNNKNAGFAGLTVSGMGNYSGSKLGSFTITKAPLSVIADNKSKFVGQTDPTFTASYSGLAGTETASVLTGTLTFSRATGEAKGDYDITPAGYNATQTNYTLTYVKGVLTISGTNVASAQITVDPILDLTYNGAAQSPAPVVKDGTTTLVKDTDYSLAYSNNTDAGTASITITGLGQYFSVRTITYKIKPFVLTITAAAKTKVYGVNDPEFTYSQSAAIGSEVAAFTGALSRAAGQNVATSPYPINLGNLTLADNGMFKASNYLINFVSADLTITKATLTARVNNDAKFVGQPDATGYAGISYSGFAYGEDKTTANIDETNLVYTRSNSTVNAANVYAGVLSATGATAPNYTITSYGVGDYTIVAADQLVLKIGNASTVYGTAPIYTVESAKYAKEDSPGVYTITDLTSTTTVSGSTVTVQELVGGVSTTTAIFDLAPQGTSNSTSTNLKVGSYTVEPGTITQSSPNFNNSIVIVGSLAVTQKELKAVVSGGTTKVYDGKTAMSVLTLGFNETTHPTFSPITNDLVTVNGSGSYASKDVGSGTYTVSNLGLSGTDAANYYVSGGASATIAGTGGTITVKTLTVTPIANQSKVFGATDPTLVYTYAGNVDGETPSFTGALSRDTGEPQGTYNILAGDLAMADNTPFLKDNYSLAFTSAVKFTINKKDLAATDISINPIASLVYNGADQTPSPVVKEGANTLNLTTDYTVTSYVNNKNVGTATITITGAGNYTGTRTVTFQITKAPLTITASAATKAFGETEPSSFAVSYSGFKASETEINVTALPALAISRQAGEKVGTYVITPSAATYANYTVTFENGLFTIGAKDFSSTDISIASIADVVYQGFANTPSPVVKDGSTTLTEGTHYTVSYSNNVNVGTATVTVTGIGNYTGTKSVNFNITTKALSITADSKSITFGEASPALTVTYSGFVSGENNSALLGTLAVSRGTEVNVGVYTGSIVATGFTSTNYLISYLPGTFTISAKAITANDITVSSLADITYTGTAHSPEPIVKDGATILIKNTDYTLSYSTDQINVGQVTVTITGINNYSGTRTQTFDIVKALLTITAENKTKEFGATDPTFTATYAGFVTGESATSLSISPTFTRAAGTAVGIYAITPSAVTLANYSVSYVPGSMAITARPINASGITIDALASIAYTGTAHTPLPVIKDGATTLQVNIDYTLSYSANINAGTVTITISGKGNYSGTNSTAFAITKIPLTITAQSNGKVYGENDPILSVVYGGFVSGDNEGKLGGTFAISRAPGEIPGDYTITPSGSTSVNYTITFPTAIFTITAKAMSSADITVAPIADVIYKGTAFTPTITVMDKGVALESPRDFTYVHTNNTNAGTATITITGVGNYSGTKTVNFTIKKKALTIRAEDKQKVYGTNDPTLTVSYTGFENGETFANLLNTQTIVRASGQSLGIYAITASGYTSDNYAITYVPGTFAISSKLISSTDVVTSGVSDKVYTGVAQTQSTLLVKDGSTDLIEGTHYSLIYTNNTYVGTATIRISGIGDYTGSRSINFAISKAPLIVTADAKSKVFGEDDPNLTTAYSGFVATEDKTVLGSSLLISRVAGEQAASYVITPSGYTSLNYNISFVPGSFTINTKAIDATGMTIAAIDAVTYTGLAHSPTPEVKDGTKVLVLNTDYTLTYTSNKDAGTAVVTVAGIGNYSGSRIVNFTINKAPLRIIAVNNEKVFGATEPTLIANYDGFVNGENETNLSVVPTISRDSGNPVNTYAIKITPSSVNLPNYNITFVDGIFTINKKVISDAQITASKPADVVYNGLAHNLLPEIKDQGITLVKDTDYTLDYSDNVNAGTVTISINGIGNYSGSREVSFAITKADLTITAQDKNKVFGEQDPAFTAIYTGFKDDDDEFDLNGIFELNRVAGTNVGTYEIEPSGSSSTNYNITFVKGLLTILKKDIAAGDISVGVIPTLTYSGLAQTPQPSITDRAEVMVLGRDYTLSYANNLNVGTGTITITGIGNYELTRTLDFSIEKAILMIKADDKTITFGETQPDLTVSYDSFVSEETTDDLSGALTISRSLGDASGEYAITATGWTSDNYNITFMSGKFIINKKAIDDEDITVSSVLPVVYNGLAHVPDPVLNDYGVLLVKGIDYEVAYSSNVNAGTASIIFTGLNNYTGTKTVTFTIELAPLTIEPDHKDKVFGEVDPELTVSYTGLVNGEDAEDLLGTLAISREEGEDVGYYTITASGYTSNNYSIVYNEGNLTIQTKSFNDSNISIASIADLSYKGSEHTPEPLIKDGAKEMVLNRDYTLSYTDNLIVGMATVTINGIGNYVDSKTLNFNIVKAPLIVRANNKVKTYGETDPILTVTYEGFVGTETTSVLSGSLSISRISGEINGIYDITATGWSSTNYDIVFVTGNLTIGTKAISNKDIRVANIPAPTYSGLVHTPDPILDDGGTILIKGTDYEMAYSSNLNAGTASITFSGINNFNGTKTVDFTIKSAPLNIEAENKDKVFGELDPELTVTYTGFVNGQSAADLLGTLALSRASGEAAGAYTITANGFNSSNYGLVYKTGIFTIKTKSLASADISVESIANVVYRGTAFTPEPLTKDGAKTMVLNRDYTLSYLGNVDVGTATITIKGIGNYSGTKTTSFVITKKVLTVLSNNNSKLIGAIDPVLTVSYTGFVTNESPSNLSGKLVITREAGEEMGTYIITANGLTSSNYEIVYNTGTFVIGDTVNPTVIFKNITVKLAANGQVVVKPSDVDNGSYDAGGISLMSLVPNTFTCDNVRTNNVMFTITDFNNNVSSAEVKITIINDAPDTDGDGMKDNCDPDDDNDGVIDTQELIDGTNSLSNCSLKIASRTLQPDEAWKKGDCDNDGLTNEVDGIEDCDKDGKENFIDSEPCLIDILMAKVFTPNGDGINDTVKPVLYGIEKFVCFKVYNRWGNPIFITQDREAAWDGGYRTQEQSTETFQWLSEGYDRDGKLIRRTGMVTLLR